MNVALSEHISASALRPDRIMQGLTPMQEAYCQARAAGAKPSEAYREAFECEGWKPASIASDAWRLERRADIVQRTTELLAERHRQTTLAPLLSKEFVVHNLMRLALTADKESVQATCTIALGKVAGIDLFRDIHVTEKRVRTPEEIDAELKDRLALLSRTIDVTVAPDAIEPTADPLKVALDVLKAGEPAPKDRRRKPRG